MFLCLFFSSRSRTLALATITAKTYIHTLQLVLDVFVVFRKRRTVYSFLLCFYLNKYSDSWFSLCCFSNIFLNTWTCFRHETLRYERFGFNRFFRCVYARKGKSELVPLSGAKRLCSEYGVKLYVLHEEVLLSSLQSSFSLVDRSLRNEAHVKQRQLTVIETLSGAPGEYRMYCMSFDKCITVLTALSLVPRSRCN